MAFVIGPACVDVKDKSCIEVCPVDCIHDEPGDRMCYIEPEACIDCAVCESACPVQAIYPGNAVPSEAALFVQINAQWFEDKESARRAVDALKPPT